MSAGHLIRHWRRFESEHPRYSEVAHWQQSCFDAVIRIEEQSA
jgi:hypothetical protein